MLQGTLPAAESVYTADAGDGTDEPLLLLPALTAAPSSCSRATISILHDHYLHCNPLLLPIERKSQQIGTCSMRSCLSLVYWMNRKKKCKLLIVSWTPTYAGLVRNFRANIGILCSSMHNWRCRCDRFGLSSPKTSFWSAFFSVEQAFSVWFLD